MEHKFRKAAEMLDALPHDLMGSAVFLFSYKRLC